MLFGVVAVWTLAAVAQCSAALWGSDDFDDNTKDTSKWGPDQQENSNVFFEETNGRLELNGDSMTGQYFHVRRPWVLNSADYGAHWAAIIEVDMAAPFWFLDDDSMSLGLGVYNPNDSRDYADFVLSWSAERGTPLFYGRVVTNGQLTENIVHNIPSWSGALQLRWDAGGTTLSFLCDADGSAGGYNWTTVANVDLAAGNDNWGMSAGNTFDLAVTGQVGGGASISGTEANADNFQTIPEPATAVLLAFAASAGLALGRRRSPGG